jgi:ribosomal-protein-alanine N-acetyltransferase
MSNRPTLSTERLILRPFILDDAPRVQKLAGEKAIASTTLNIPHPYEDGMAEDWIETHAEAFEKGESLTFAIVLKQENVLIGAVGLDVNAAHDRAEMGYWIGAPYWSNGYASEAARAVLEYGFVERKLNRICASHLSRNPASGRVMQKIGMTHEASFRAHVKKWEKFEDLEVYGILKDEFK